MNLFAMADPRPIHFMGIAGAGMSGLALLARQQGVAVTGCDTDPSGAADLAALGVEIWRGGAPPSGEHNSAHPSQPKIVYPPLLSTKKKKKDPQCQRPISRAPITGMSV